jgi:hypothetical protein
MKTILAMAWRLNDLPRLEKHLSTLQMLYAGFSIVTPSADERLIDRARQLPGALVRQATGQNWRYETLQQALEFEDTTHIHYCDGDHVAPRLETNLEDWKGILTAMRNADCLIVGRSPEVFDSYPRPLRDTEAIINTVASQWFGFPVDLGSGSRGFSRRAAEYLVQHASPQTHGVATDAEWPVLLHQAGYTVGTYESAGAIYEVADDHHRARLENAEQWAKRVNIAHIIIQAGMDAMQR